MIIWKLEKSFLLKKSIEISCASFSVKTVLQIVSCVRSDKKTLS